MTGQSKIKRERSKERKKSPGGRDKKEEAWM
jgi:hypothetical protein